MELAGRRKEYLLSHIFQLQGSNWLSILVDCKTRRSPRHFRKRKFCFDIDFVFHYRTKPYDDKQSFLDSISTVFSPFPDELRSNKVFAENVEALLIDNSSGQICGTHWSFSPRNPGKESLLCHIHQISSRCQVHDGSAHSNAGSNINCQWRLR